MHAMREEAIRKCPEGCRLEVPLHRITLNKLYGPSRMGRCESRHLPRPFPTGSKANDS